MITPSLTSPQVSPYYNPLQLDERWTSLPDEQKQDDRQNPRHRMARYLMEMARSKSAPYRQFFEKDWQFLLGEGQWPAPRNSLAARQAKVGNRGTRNWIFATCDHKAQRIMEPKPRYTMIAYGAPVEFIQRWQAQEALEDELRRLHVTEHGEMALWDGMALGKGYTRVLVKEDPRSGMPRPALEDLDPGRLYADPDAFRIRDGQSLHYESTMNMAQIRTAFPKTWMKVKPRTERITGSPKPGQRLDYRSRTDSEILSGMGRDLISTKRGDVLDAMVEDVCYTWIADESVVREVEQRMLKGERLGHQCASCGTIFEASEPEMYDAFPESQEQLAAPPPVTCPDCQSEAIAPMNLPPEYEDVASETRYAYPYGQLIVHTKDAILYDGPNDVQVDGTFPVAEYFHYRVNRRFQGFSEVNHLRTSQVNANKNMQQLMDYLRTSINGVLEYPDDVPLYESVGNYPNARIGMPYNLIGLARYLPPATFNLQAFIQAEETIRRDFQQMSGITDFSTGTAPNAPTSGAEVEARDAAGSTRLGGHQRRFGEYHAELGNLVWQVMWQCYTTPRYFPVRNSDGRPEMTPLTLSALPRNMRLLVSCDPVDRKKSELTGQVIQQLMQSQILPTWFDLLLPAMGLPTYDAETITNRMQLMQHEQAQMMDQMPPEMDPAQYEGAMN